MTDKIIVGDIDWMRNDYISDINVGGISYPSVEHAYQASKFSNLSIRLEIADAEDVRTARNIGRGTSDIDPNWNINKFRVMEQLVRAKFTQDYELGERLAKTGNAEIVMQGYDSFWGTGRSGDGDNNLGHILESVRSEIQFITGIHPYDYEDDYDDEDEYDDEDNCPPNLREALENNPDNELLNACQDLYEGTKSLMTLIDTNDYDAAFISRRTGVNQYIAEDAINKLRKMQSAINTLSDLLQEEEDEETSKKDDPTYLKTDSVRVMTPVEDDPDDDHPDDDWLSSFD